jgi:hypothetical protein
MRKIYRIAFVAVGVMMGFGLTSAKTASAEGDWKKCSEWDYAQRCLTCVQALDCGSNPVCCKKPAAD